MIATIKSPQAIDENPILAKESSFLKRRASKRSPPFIQTLFNPFLSVLHQNKTLYNFHRREQRLIAGRIRALYIYYTMDLEH